MKTSAPSVLEDVRKQQDLDVPVSLVNHLLNAFIDESRVSGLRVAALRLLRSSRSLLFPRRSLQVQRLLSQRQRDLCLEPREFFFHLQYRHFLARGLATRARIDAVVHHYEDEARRYLPSFGRQVYREQGLMLWETVVDKTHFSIMLEPPNDNRWEGALSVVLHVNGSRLSVMSFTCIDARHFGQPPGPVFFITRNQSGREAVPQGLFRSAFKHTTPPYFCLAALSGLAEANGMGWMAAVQHDAHAAWEAEYDAHLRNSYTEFWHAFHATSLSPAACALPVPMAMTPLSEVKAKHRQRAVARRQAWATVAQSAALAIAQHRRMPGSGRTS